MMASTPGQRAVQSRARKGAPRRSECAGSGWRELIENHRLFPGRVFIATGVLSGAVASNILRAIGAPCCRRAYRFDKYATASFGSRREEDNEQRVIEQALGQSFSCISHSARW